MPWYVNRRGERLWYEDEGNGYPVLLLLHGWCMSSAVWSNQYDELTPLLRLIAPDLRGHGRSRGVSEHLDFDTFADDIVDLCQQLKLSHTVLVGWSMGGQIALHSYAQLADRLARLVLVAATPRFIAAADFPYGLTPSEGSGMRLKLQRNTQRALDGFHTRMFAEGDVEAPGATSHVQQQLSAIPLPYASSAVDSLDALVAADMRHVLSSIAVPTLIVNGDCDRICLPQASRYLKDHIHGAEQVVFPHCGHAPFLTHSHQFNAELTQFIRSVRE
jgi:pimeloyl-[acyl-carrier protein] methyl ester esterase